MAICSGFPDEKWWCSTAIFDITRGKNRSISSQHSIRCLVMIYKPLVFKHSYWKMVIFSGFTHWKWWFSIVMLVFQRVSLSATWLTAQEQQRHVRKSDTTGMKTWSSSDDLSFYGICLIYNNITNTYQLPSGKLTLCYWELPL